jgi:hypothetical protein
MYDRNAFLALSTGLWISVTLLAGFWMVGALMVGPVTYLLHTYVPGQTAPAPNSQFVTKQTHAIAYVSLGHSTGETVGWPRGGVTCARRLRRRQLGTDTLFPGLTAWRIVVPASYPGFNPGVGGVLVEGWRSIRVTRAGESPRVCPDTVRTLRRGPQRGATEHRTSPADSQSVHAKYRSGQSRNGLVPRKIDRSWLLKAVQLRWDVTVQK